jgi:hypothetical protein
MTAKWAENPKPNATFSNCRVDNRLADIDSALLDSHLLSWRGAVSDDGAELHQVRQV